MYTLGSAPRSVSTLFGDARWQSWDDLKQSGLLGDRGIPIGIHAPFGCQQTRLFYKGNGHILTCARPRSGKFTTQLAQTALSYGGSLLCFDPKGEIAATCSRARRDVLVHDVRHLNPFGLFTGRPWGLRQDRFNPLAAIDPDRQSFIADISSLCQALIITDSKDSHWADSARDLCSEILIELITRQKSAATLPKMREILGRGRDEWLEYLKTFAVSRSGEHPALSVARIRLTRFAADTREVASIFSTALTQTEFLDDPALANCLSGDDFRLSGLKERPQSVFVILPANYARQYSRFMRLILVSALNKLTSTQTGTNRNVLVLMDEFVTTIGYLPVVEDALNYAAGFGVQLWPVIQDLGSLQRVYRNSWQTFLSAADVTQFFGINDLPTAEYLSHRCGQFTAEITSDSFQVVPSYDPYCPQLVQRGLSRGLIGRPLITPEQAIGLDPGSDRQLLLIPGNANPVLCSRWPYYLDPAYSWLANTNPYHP